ncbi:polysaccharide export protein [Thioclava sp. BHET1]|nr:polysaccharide export protein [Thioclava sp. BHET1]
MMAIVASVRGLRLILLAFALFCPPLAQAKDLGGYRLRPGDRLQIQVLQDHGLDRSVLVLPDGSITFPFIGPVAAAGRSLGDLQATLVRKLTPNFAMPPDVTISVTALAPAATARRAVITVYIMGEVTRPGAIEIAPGTTLLQFLAAAGGLTQFAAPRRIEVHRLDPRMPAEQLMRIDLARGVAAAARLRLQPGDVVIVPERRLFEFE